MASSFLSAVLFLPIIIVCFVDVLALVPTEFQSPQESSRVSDFTSSKTLYNAHSHPHPLLINCWTILSWNLDFHHPLGHRVVVGGVIQLLGELSYFYQCTTINHSSFAGVKD